MVKPAMTRVDSSSSSSSSPTSCNESFSTTTCKMYKGVRKRKWGKWVSEIRLPNSRERIWLGSYDTQEKAARAFDAALYCLRGKGASFNFPDTPRLLEMDSLKIPCSHQEIQEAAAKFANKVVEIFAEEDGEVGVQSESMSDHTTDTNTNTEFPIYGGTNHDVQVDQDTMDWTFMNMLDDLNGSDFGLYFEAEKGEFSCPTTHTPLLFHNGDEVEVDDHDHDAFSNHSFLWSWNF
ncbi:ethylene-responsive transcription factor ERF017-like [Vigna unguiculata]|uniref:EREBP-like factor n=1 Tax=Vigna unguiculata TaxID=3917 RepID=A0A4D6MCV4_VIGUN|nr:ethylene-responsive transcription factor ERF017-like [Vigna unguiculata]QCD99262.1 EREBP-like factor [Vigna unguiculata]